MFGRFGYLFGTSESKLGRTFCLVYAVAVVLICVGLAVAVNV